MSDDNFFKYRDYLAEVAKADLACVHAKDKSYGGSWKRGGGRSAWWMLRRKIDRLLEMMRHPDPPAGWPRMVGQDRDTVVKLVAMTRAEDIFAMIEVAAGGEDGTVLAEVRDLRRYLLLVEAEMVARGVVVLPKAERLPMSASGAKRDYVSGTPEDGGHHARYVGEPSAALHEVPTLRPGDAAAWLKGGQGSGGPPSSSQDWVWLEEEGSGGPYSPVPDDEDDAHG